MAVTDTPRDAERGRERQREAERGRKIQRDTERYLAGYDLSAQFHLI